MDERYRCDQTLRGTSSAISARRRSIESSINLRIVVWSLDVISSKWIFDSGAIFVASCTVGIDTRIGGLLTCLIALTRTPLLANPGSDTSVPSI